MCTKVYDRVSERQSEKMREIETERERGKQKNRTESGDMLTDDLNLHFVPKKNNVDLKRINQRTSI